MDKLRNKIYNILRRGEEFFKTDMFYLAKGGSWLSLGYGVAILSGFAISIAFANLFAKESFGTYKFILSMTGLLGIFSLSGMGTAVTQAVARGLAISLNRSFKINLKWNIGILLGGLAVSLYYYVNGNTLLSLSFLLVGILSPITLSAGLYGAYLFGKKDFRRISFYGMIHNIVPAGTIIVALFLTESIIAIITVYFVFGALVSLFLYYQTIRAYRQKGNEENPDLLSYSKHLTAMEIIGKIARNLDKIIIFHYLGAVPLAIYAFAIAPVEQLQGGKKILGSLILPKISGRPFKELQKSAPRKALILTIYALVLAGTYAFLAPYFYKFLYPQYLDSVLYSQIYSLTLLAVSGTIFNQILIAHKKKKELYLHQIIVPAVQIALFLILLPHFGLMGLIVAHVITRSFAGILSYYYVMRPFSN